MPANISGHAERAEALEEMAAKVARSAERLKQLEDCTPEEARAIRRERGNPFAPPAAELFSIEDIQFPLDAGATPARLYRPVQHADLQPALLFFHGGGFVLGNVDQYDTVCQQLAYHSQCMVISVEYTLAPTARIKQIHQQGFECWQWLAQNAASLGIDSSRVAIGGDSAGGNLTLGVLLLCKKLQAVMPAFQVLIYPSVDVSMSFPSVDEFAEGYFLTKKGMRWFRSHYLESPEQGLDMELAYLRQDVSGLPAAHVITAGFDPLRDEGQAFVDHLTASGVPVTHTCYTDQIHAFVSFAGGIAAGLDAIKEIGEILRAKL